MKSENNEQKYLTLLEEIINQDNDSEDIIKFLEEAYVEDKEWVQNKVEYIYTNGNVDDFLKNIKNDILNDFKNSNFSNIDYLYANILKKIQSNIDKRNIEYLIEKEIKNIIDDKSVIIDYEVEQLVDIEKSIKKDDFYTTFYKKLKYKYFNYNSLVEKWNKEKDEIIEELEKINLIFKNIEQSQEIMKIQSQIKLIQEQIKKNEIELEKFKVFYNSSISRIKYARNKNEINSEKIIREISLLEKISFNAEVEKISELKNYFETNYKNVILYVWTELNYQVNDEQLNIFEEITIKTELNNIFNSYLKEKYKNLDEERNNECLNELDIFQNIKQKYLNDASDSYYKTIENLKVIKKIDLVKIQENINRLSNEYEDIKDSEIEASLEKIIEHIHINADANSDELEFDKEANKIVENVEIENFKKILSYNIISINENNTSKLENIYQLYLNLYEKIKQENRIRNIEEDNNHERLYRIDNGFFSWIINRSDKPYRNEEMYYEIQREFEREFETGFEHEQYTERQFRMKINRARDRIIMRSNEKYANRDEIDRIIKSIYQRILSNPITNVISHKKEDYLELKKDIIIEKLKLILDVYIYIKLREYLLNRDNEKIIELAKKLKKEEYGWKEYGLSAYLSSRK